MNWWGFSFIGLWILGMAVLFYGIWRQEQQLLARQKQEREIVRAVSEFAVGQDYAQLGRGRR